MQSPQMTSSAHPAQTDQGSRNFAAVLDTLVAQNGSGSHHYITGGNMLADRNAKRNLADAVHFLCILHGRFPGVVDYASQRIAHDEARQWMIAATDAFVRERAYLTKLAVAAGPIPSTLGHQKCEATVGHQRHALGMLAQSDRRGCAVGASLALALDWRMVRAIVDTTADRLDITPPECTLPSVADTAALAMTLAEDTAVERAMHFGATQLLSQHNGLWDLLAAREIARRDQY